MNIGGKGGGSVNKRLSVNLVANTLSFLVQIVASLVITRFVVERMGDTANGYVVLTTNFLNYTTIFVAALNATANRFVAINFHQGRIKTAAIFLNSLLVGDLVLAGIFGVVFLILVGNLQDVIQIQSVPIWDVKALFGLVLGGSLLSIATSAFTVATFVRNRLDLQSIRQMLAQFIRVCLLLILFILFAPHIFYIGIANLAATLYIVRTNIKYTKRLLPNIRFHPRFFRLYAIKNLLSAGIWNSISQLSNVLLSQMDVLIAESVLGASIAGVYSVALVVPSFMQTFVYMIASLFLPQFAATFAKGNRKKFIREINQSMKFLGLLITIPLGILMVYGDVFFSFWVPSLSAAKLHELSNLTLVPIIVTGSINTLLYLYTIINRLKAQSLALLVAGVVNLSVVLLLLHTTSLGVIAIPLVSMIVLTVKNLIWTPLYAARCLHVRWHTFYAAILRGIFCAGAVILISLLVRQIFPHDALFGSVFVFIVACALSALLSLAANTILVIGPRKIARVFALGGAPSGGRYDRRPDAHNIRRSGRPGDRRPQKDRYSQSRSPRDHYPQDHRPRDHYPQDHRPQDHRPQGRHRGEFTG